MYVCMFINVLVGSDNFMQHMLSITGKGNNVLWLKMTRNSNSSKNKWYYRGTKMFRERPIHAQAD